MGELLIATKQFIIDMTQSHSRPVLLWSGGKDSMVLLHVLRSMNLFWPVILYRNNFFPHKYAFIDRMIRDWRLTVFEYPPLSMGLKQKNGQVEMVSFYNIGALLPLHLPTNMLPVDRAWDWQCGIELLNRPKGTMQFPWDLLCVGHKSCDEDITEGKLTLHTAIHHIEQGPDVMFPLRDWTHDDVWHYTEQYHVPVQETRYEHTTAGWREREDKTYNPDCTPICIRCLDKRLEGDVDCPLLGKTIPNISRQIAYLPDHGLTYFGEPVHA